MKLYYCPGACSLADHIALHEAGATFEVESVDLRTKRTASGGDFVAVERKGYVPVLVLDDGQRLTENIAVLDYLATLFPQLAPDGPLGRMRMLEALAYISTELHKSFKPFWHHATEVEKDAARARIASLMQLLADGMKGDYLFGDRPSVADFYLFVMLLWAERFGIAVPASFADLRARLKARPSVRTAMKIEGLTVPADVLVMAASPLREAGS